MNYKEKYESDLKKFAILNSAAQSLLLIVLSVPMFLYERYLFLFAALWFIGSGYFMYLTIQVKFVNKIWNFFSKIFTKQIK